MTTPAAGRGGTPPRPAGPARTPAAQWFVFGAWVYDIQAAGQLLREVPRPDRLLPVAVWAGAYGLDREPGASPHTIALIGPGPGFDPAYAMSTDLSRPVIVATFAIEGQPDTPLLIDGTHRLYKAHVSGVVELPCQVLDTAETRAIRRPACRRPPRIPATPGGSP
jgi:hypothetical protein